MKRLIGLTGLLVLAITGCEALQMETRGPCNFEGYKYYNGEKDTLGEMSRDYVLIGVDSSRSNDEIVSFINADKNSAGDALHMANHFYETGLFEAAEPDIITMVVEE